MIIGTPAAQTPIAQLEANIKPAERLPERFFEIYMLIFPGVYMTSIIKMRKTRAPCNEKPLYDGDHIQLWTDKCRVLLGFLILFQCHQFNLQPEERIS